MLSKNGMDISIRVVLECWKLEWRIDSHEPRKGIFLQAYFVKLTNHTSVGLPVWRIKDSIWLAGGDEKRSGKPVVVKHLPLGTNKGEVETHIRSWLKIWWGE